MKRSSVFFATLIWGSAARAQDRPIPPGNPPPITPALEQQTRARIDAEDRQKLAPDAWQSGISEVDDRRRSAWMSRSEEARPAEVPARTPFIEAGSALRLGFIAECKCAHYGAEATFGFRMGPWFTLELPLGILHGERPSSPSWTMLSVRPAFAVTAFSKGQLLYARIGPDILVPVDTGLPLPPAMVGGYLSGGWVFYLASLGDAGYVGVSLDVSIALRGSIDSKNTILDNVRFGVDSTMGFKVGF